MAQKSYPFETIFEWSEVLSDTWGHLNRFSPFKAKLNRQDFGIEWNKTLGQNKMLLGDVISIEGHFQIQPTDQITPSWKHRIPDTPGIRKREKLARGEISSISSPITNTQDPARSFIPKPKKLDKKKVRDPQGPLSLMFWASFTMVALVGLWGMIEICLKIKFFFVEKFKAKYEETGKWGWISDLIIYPLGLLYLMALWNLQKMLEISIS